MALTDKQRVFIAEYLEDFNATRAAAASGYSEKTARQMGAENLSKPVIREEIDRIVTERCMGKEETLMRLAAHARGDIDDYLDDAGHFDLGKARAAKRTRLIKKLKTRTSTRLIDDESIITTEVEFELYDAQAALALLGKHHKLFVERHEHTGEDGGPIEYKDATDLSDEQLARIAADGRTGIAEPTESAH